MGTTALLSIPNGPAVTLITAVASYQNPAVTARFIHDYNKTPEQADDCFDELKEFLARASFAPHRIEPPSKDVDHMWHTFLLFTRDYASFCSQYLGKFIHHVPRPSMTDCDPAPGCDGDQ